MSIGTPVPELKAEEEARGRLRRPRRQLGPDLEDQMLRGCYAMARYALGSGKAVPANIMDSLHLLKTAGLDASELPGPSGKPQSAIALLTRAHTQLSQIVAPATPRTLLLVEEDRQDLSRWRFLGPVRIIRRLMAVGLVCLLGFIVTTISPWGTGRVNLAQDWGLPLLANELLLLFAAGIGAAFAALFKVNSYVTEGTYDPRYDASYWARFALGLLAGMVLALLIPVDDVNSRLGQPILALLGGFSASVVYRLLARLVETLESLVQG
ncbi:MAG TPA: hypothetical protein VHJ78_03420, partial [Actinomycetota bacterium]|nr:hypothetical protein [Actinomycetota bacterium]